VTAHELWVDWLAWAEYCYNTSFHTALRATHSRWSTAALLRSRDEILVEVRQRLLQAQQLSKKYYDANHRDVEFAIGDWVWLRLLHRTAQSLDPVPSTSWGLAMQGRSRCWNASATSPTACSFRRAPASMTSSMWGC
jgi:hypothetical protein